MTFKPLTYSVDSDNGVLSLSVKDINNFSGTGNKSLSSYVSGVKIFFIVKEQAYSEYSMSSSSCSLAYAYTPSIPGTTASNNTEYVAIIPLVAETTGTIDIFCLTLPSLDITINSSTTFDVGDMFCYYNTITSQFDVYMCMVNNANPTIPGNISLLSFNDTIIPNSNFNILRDAVLSVLPPNPFKVSLGIQIDCHNTSFVISDETTYIIDGSEPSLEVDEFNAYTIVTVTPPVGDTFTVATGYPASNGMYDISIDITELGDGLYVFNYYNVPSFDDTKTYQPDMAVVDSSGQLWLNEYGATSSLSNFTAITQSQLPSQYTFTQAFVVACTRLGCSVATYQTAFCGNCGNCDKCCNNKAFGQTAKTGVLLDYLNNGFTSEQKLLSNYSEQVSNVLTALNTICQF